MRYHAWIHLVDFREDDTAWPFGVRVAWDIRLNDEDTHDGSISRGDILVTLFDEHGGLAFYTGMDSSMRATARPVTRRAPTSTSTFHMVLDST
jgi:hypothetical protein